MGFTLDQINDQLKECTPDEKIKLINQLLEVLYKTDKLKHAFPPIKIQHFKKQNAKRYNFKELFEDMMSEGQHKL